MSVETIKEPNPDEIVLLKFSWGKVPIDEIKAAYDNLKNKFPNNEVIALDENMEFYIQDKQIVLETLWDMIRRIS